MSSRCQCASTVCGTQRSTPSPRRRAADMSLCIICEGDEPEHGYPCCSLCLDTYGTEPGRLESIAAHQASIRSLRVTQAGLTNALEGVRRSVKARRVA